MRATVLTLRNPFDPLGSRERRELRRPVRLRTLAPRTRQPHIAYLNGRPLLRAGWRRRLRHGDVVTFVVLPAGGSGGGAGGSNPLRTILSLALVVAAPMLAGAIFGVGAAGLAATPVLFGTYTVGQATALGILLAGQALIGSLFPVPQPGRLPEPSPTYSIGAQGNAARIEQPIPVQYGRMLAWPDLAAQPYTDYAGNEQYLYQLLCLGAGEYDIEAIRIEDTPIASFSEIETEIVGPGEQVTLFPTAVITAVEVSGQTLAGMKVVNWSQTGTTLTVTETAHGRASGQTVALIVTAGGATQGIYAIATVPDADSYTLVMPGSLSDTGTGHIHAVVGGLSGFAASGPGTVAQRIAVDLVLPVGLFDGDGAGAMGTLSLGIYIQMRRIDDDGAPLGAWIDIAETVTDRTNTPIRRSYVYDLATPGRYAVRAWRVDTKSADPNDGNEVAWAGLRAYLTETQDWGDVTLIALRMRATNNLSLQASRRVSVLATRKLPAWDGTAWSAPEPSRSIAWAIADAARNAGHGAGLADSAIDLAALLALDAVWTERGDRFDARFDQAASWWEAVGRIAGAGRAKPFMQGGKLRIARDGPAGLPVALYSMRSIRRGSFAVDYLMASETTADAVEVSYFDATTWQPRRVTATLPGSTAAKPARVELFGVTDRAQALRDGLYLAAANRYRRRVVRFATEMEGFIPTIGDLIAIQHDTPAWGAQAEAVAWDPGPRRLLLSEPMSFGAGTHYVGLRRADGGVSGPWAVSAGDLPEAVILAEDPDIQPQTGTDRERTHVVFGPGEQWATLAKVASVRPRGLFEVEIEALPDDPSVHTADTGAVAPAIPLRSLPLTPVQPAVADLNARRIPGDATRAVLSWRPAPGAELYQVEMAEGADIADPDVSWTRTADTTAAHQVIGMLYADRTLIRVRGIGLAAGPWAAAALGDLIPYMWTADDAAMWTADSNPMWT